MARPPDSPHSRPLLYVTDLLLLLHAFVTKSLSFARSRQITPALDKNIKAPSLERLLNTLYLYSSSSLVFQQEYLLVVKHKPLQDRGHGGLFASYFATLGNLGG